MKPLSLSKTYTAGPEVFSAIEFREPLMPDYRAIGPVLDIQSRVILRDREAIFAYVDRLAIKPPAGALAVLDLGDAMALEDHIVDFFIEARVSRASPTNSSSASDGAPKPSIG